MAYYGSCWSVPYWLVTQILKGAEKTRIGTFLRAGAVVKLPSHRWGIPKFETTRLYVCQTRGKVSNKHKAFHKSNGAFKQAQYPRDLRVKMRWV